MDFATLFAGITTAFSNPPPGTTSTATGTFISGLGTDTNINPGLMPNGGGGGTGGYIIYPSYPPGPPVQVPSAWIPTLGGPLDLNQFQTLTDELQEAKDYATELEMELSKQFGRLTENTEVLVEEYYKPIIEASLIQRLKEEGWKEPG